MAVDEIPTVRTRRVRPLFGRGHKFMREKFHGKMFLVPSCITVVGIFCGFLGLVSAIQGRYEYATKCILFAIVLDGLDGRVARTLNATSAFGREFDSLSDMVAFGVAPAVLTYCWAFRQTADEFGLLVAFVFIVCGAARLARFNVVAETSGDSKQNFTGLPIPGAAAAIAGLVYAFPDPIDDLMLVGFLCFYMTLIAVLMVSTIPFFSLKRVKFPSQENRVILLVGLAFLVALTWKYSRVVLLVGTTVYAMSGFAQYAFRKMRRTKKDQTLKKVV